MKIAVLSDIHANIYALRAVLKDCALFDIKSFFILGDLIGYYYWPKEVLDTIDKLASVDIVLGNHEVFLKESLENKLRRSEIKKKYGSGIEYAMNTLSDKQKSMLLSLPPSKIKMIDGIKFLLCHGSPSSTDQYIYPTTNADELNQCAVSSVDFVFMGHTHYPFINCYNKTILANPGSVGQPRDIGNLASYLIIDTENKSIIFRRVAFNIEKLIEMAIKVDPALEYLQKTFSRNVLSGDNNASI